MKILLTGANGQLGQEIINFAYAHNMEIIATTKQQLDITQFAETQQKITALHPDLIINTATYTKVDQAETEIELAFAVNALGAKNLALICKILDIPLIHFSTDYVFDGKKESAYIETDDTNPINIYGKSKLQGEHYIQEILEKYLILRTSWLFGEYGNNFPKTILTKALSAPELNVVNDQHGCPTATKYLVIDLFKILPRLLQHQKSWGIYHYCNAPATTWYAFAKEIIAQAQQHISLSCKKISPIPSSELNGLVLRPKNSVLCQDKILYTFGLSKQYWQNYLTYIIKQFETV